MNNPLRSRGMADVAYESYALASKNAGIDINTRLDKRVVQAIGNAPASKGFHAKDGVLNDAAYTATADLSIRGLSRMQIATWIEELGETGWVAFFRNWEGNEHIHGQYCGLPMKDQLDAQCEDYFVGKDGLVGHRRIDDEYWFPEKEVRVIAERLFRQSNPRNGEKGIVVRSPSIELPKRAPALSVGFYLNNEKLPRFWMPLIDKVAYAPVRAFGGALGFDTQYNPETKTISYDNHDDLPISLKIIGGVGHAPVRQLVREVGLRIVYVDMETRKVVVTR